MFWLERRTNRALSSANYHHDINHISKQVTILVFSITHCPAGTSYMGRSARSLCPPAFFVRTTCGSQEESLHVHPCWRCTSKTSTDSPASIKCQYHPLCFPSSCKHSHPSGLSFLFPAGKPLPSKAEAETRMLQCDFPQAPTFSPLFTFPRLCPEEVSIQSCSFPPKKRLLGELGKLHTGCSSPGKLTSERDEARAAVGKLIMEHGCLLQRTCSITLCREMSR